MCTRVSYTRYTMGGTNDRPFSRTGQRNEATDEPKARFSPCIRKTVTSMNYSPAVDYSPLDKLTLENDTRITLATVAPPPKVTLDSPAHLVMTDFTVTPAAFIEPDARAATAHDYMLRRGV